MQFSPSPDGTRFAFACEDGATWSDRVLGNLCIGTGASASVVVRGDALNPRGVFKPASGWGFANAVWSPDGLRLTFTVFPADSIIDGTPPSSTYALDLRTGAVTQLTSYTESTSWITPRWAPDSSSIAMLSGSNVDALTVFDPDTGARTSVGANVSYVVNVGAYAWSPDSGSIAFGATDTADTISASLYIFDIAGRSVAKIADAAAFGEVAWSPDGESLALTASADPPTSRTNRTTSWIVRRDGSDLRRVDGKLYSGSGPYVWAPDGRHLVLTGIDASDKRGIFVGAADGSPATLLVEFPRGSPTSPALHFAVWSPGSSEMVFTNGGYCYKGFCVSGKLFLYDPASGRTAHLGDRLVDAILRPSGPRT